MDDLQGFSQLASFMKHTANEAVRGLPLMVDFGVIGADQSLTTNSYPQPIPVGDYLVCRQLTQGATDKVLTKTAEDGWHDHSCPLSGHSQQGPHVHKVLIPEKMRSIKAGDRVLVVWVGDDAVVIDIIYPAKEAFTYNV